MTIYNKIKTWIWLNIITVYWGDYIVDEINDCNTQLYEHKENNYYEDLD